MNKLPTNAQQATRESLAKSEPRLSQPQSWVDVLLKSTMQFGADDYILALTTASNSLSSRRLVLPGNFDRDAGTEGKTACRERMHFDSPYQLCGGIVQLQHCEGRKLIVIGDVHGDLQSFEKILRHSRFIQRALGGEDIFLAILGDFINKGPHSTECTFLLAELLSTVELQDRVIVLRGNHEDPEITPRFTKKNLLSRHLQSLSEHSICREAPAEQVYAIKRVTSDFFGELPFGILTSHGGGFFHGGCTRVLREVAKKQNHYSPRALLYEWPLNEEIAYELLNSDIVRKSLDPKSKLSTDVTPKEMFTFMEQLGIRTLFRGHQVSPDSHIASRKSWETGVWTVSNSNRRRPRTVITVNSNTLLKQASAAYVEVNLGGQSLLRKHCQGVSVT